MDINQAIVMAMPLVSLPFKQLLVYTINYSDISDQEKKKLTELVEKNIKTAPGTSCYTINKGDKKIEMYIDMVDKDFDVTENIKEAVKDMNFINKEYKDMMNHAGQLVTFVNIYFDALMTRVPDIFKSINKSLKVPKDGAFEGVFIADDRKMFFDPRTDKQLCVRFKYSVEPAKEPAK